MTISTTDRSHFLIFANTYEAALYILTIALIIFKVDYNYFIIFQYHYLNTCLKILKFYENWNFLKILSFWHFLKILKSYEHLEFFWNFFNFEFFWKFRNFEMFWKLKFLKNFEILKFLENFEIFHFRILKIGKPRPERVLIFPENFGLSGGFRH